jgi:hypothetical protein
MKLIPSIAIEIVVHYHKPYFIIAQKKNTNYICQINESENNIYFESRFF